MGYGKNFMPQSENIFTPAEKLWNKGFGQEVFASVGLLEEFFDLQKKYGTQNITLSEKLGNRQTRDLTTDIGGMTYGEWLGHKN